MLTNLAPNPSRMTRTMATTIRAIFIVVSYFSSRSTASITLEMHCRNESSSATGSIWRGLMRSSRTSRSWLQGCGSKVNQHDPGRHIGHPEEEDDGHQALNLRPGKLDQIRAHHTGDGAAGSDHRYAGNGIEKSLGERRRHTAKQVEQQEFLMAQNIFDVVAENPEEPHVAQYVEPA